MKKKKKSKGPSIVLKVWGCIWCEDGGYVEEKDHIVTMKKHIVFDCTKHPMRDLENQLARVKATVSAVIFKQSSI